MGKVALTGKYESKKDSFTVNLSYLADDNNTFFGTYSVTDEKISSFGFESGFNLGKARSMVDVTYLPPIDAAACKLSVRQGKVKMTATTTVTSVRSGGEGRQHTENFELESALSAKESLFMSFNAKSRATSLKMSRRLDPKNKIEAQYVYNKASDKFATLSYTHIYSKMHTFAANVDYGANKLNVEWNCNTDNGPWKVTSSFPFNARYVTVFFFFLFFLSSVVPFCQFIIS